MNYREFVVKRPNRRPETFLMLRRFAGNTVELHADGNYIGVLGETDLQELQEWLQAPEPPQVGDKVVWPGMVGGVRNTDTWEIQSMSTTHAVIIKRYTSDPSAFIGREITMDELMSLERC